MKTSDTYDDSYHAMLQPSRRNRTKWWYSLAVALNNIYFQELYISPQLLLAVILFDLQIIIDRCCTKQYCLVNQTFQNPITIIDINILIVYCHVDTHDDCLLIVYILYTIYTLYSLFACIDIVKTVVILMNIAIATVANIFYKTFNGITNDMHM